MIVQPSAHTAFDNDYMYSHISLFVTIENPLYKTGRNED